MKKILTLLCFFSIQLIVAQGPGCPNVNTGPDQEVDCDTSCVDLTATFLETGETNSYEVSSIPFNPPTNFNGLANQLFNNTDDIWGGVVDLPFTFCFFDTDYDQIVVGSNGVLTFDTSQANTGNGWAFSESLPNSTNPTLSEANIFGVGHDIDPAASNGTHEIAWEVKGEAPCRTFVVSYFNVAHFSCNDLKSFHMIVLYEGTNAIEVYVLDKPTCFGWNGGSAVIGIQNPAGTIAYTPPGRNTGNWSTAIEAWRFTPNGTPNYVFTWYDGSGSPIGNSPTINVCPTDDTVYTAEVVYTNCDGTIVTDSDTVTVTSVLTEDPSFTITPTCDGATVVIDGDPGGMFVLNPDPGAPVTIDPVSGTVTGGTQGTSYTIEYTTADGCSSLAQSFTVPDSNDAAFSMDATCDGGTATITGTTGGVFTLNPDPGPPVTIDPSTGTITGGTAGEIYTVEYTISGTCPDSSTQNVTVLDAADASFTMTATCDGGIATITGTTGGDFVLNPDPGPPVTIDSSTGIVTGGSAGETYTIEYIISGGCAANSTQDVTVLDEDDASFNMIATCDGGTATITGDIGGTFTLNPDPGAPVAIDPMSGIVTGGTPDTTYTIEYTTSGTCPDSSTQNVTVLTAADPTFTMTPTCDGGIATITGDSGGTFIILPGPGSSVINSSTGIVTGAMPGATYTVEYTIGGTCGDSLRVDFTVLDAEDSTFSVLENCDGGTVTIVGDSGGIFVFNPIPSDGADIDEDTGEVTNGTSGTTYTIQYTTSGPCPDDSFQNVTVLPADDPSFTMTATCEGGIAAVTGTTGGTFVLSPDPGAPVDIDVATGTVTGGSSGVTYTVEYTTAGACPETSTQDITVLDLDNPSFTMTATCDGGTATINGDIGGTFALNPNPGAPVAIDSSTGTVTGGMPNTTYTVEYTTNGTCITSTTQDVTTHPLPTVVAPTPLIVCDDATPDGLTLIDLNIKNSEINGGNSDYIVTYYLNQLDADNGMPQLIIPYPNLSNPQIIFVRVEDINTGCYDTTTLELQVEQAPIAFTPPPLEYCDADSDGFGAFDLDSTIPVIAGGDPDLVVTFHGTMQNAIDNVIPLSSLYNNIEPYTQTIYVRVESATIVTDCASFVELQLVVHDTPAIELNPTPIEECDDDIDGFAIFDLNVRDSEILNGLDPTQYIVTYYEDQADAEVPTNEIVNPGSYNSDSQIIWVRVEDNANGCYTITSLELIVNPLPLLNDPSPLELCDDEVADEMTVFDLTVKDNEITGGNPDWTVSYFETLVDSQSNSNAIDPANAYTNTSIGGNPANPQTIFVSVINSITGCISYTTLTLRVNPLPSPAVPSDLVACDVDNDGFFNEFDLESQTITILNGEPDVSVTYHETQEDADNGDNPLASLYTNIVPDIQTIYVRVENAITSCFNTTVTFQLIVNPSPEVPIDLPPLMACDDNDDGFTQFNLNDMNVEILGSQNPADFNLTYHLTAMNAEDGISPIVEPNLSNYSNITNPQIIYVRLVNITSGCVTTGMFELIVNLPPTPILPLPLELCDDEVADEMTVFDLTVKNSEITGGNPNWTVEYFETDADAQAVVSVIDPATAYTNTSVGGNPPNPQTLYVRVTNATTNCSAFTTLTIRVLPNPTPSLDPDNIELCDDNATGDSVEIFDLTINETYIINGEADVTPTYHTSLVDAETGAAAIPDPTMHSSGNATIYVRVTNDITGCYTIVTFDLIVNPLPDATAVENIVECELNTDGFYNFDLTVQDDLILNGQDPSVFEVSYYIFQADAESGTGQIATPWSYTNMEDPLNPGTPINPQEIFVNVLNTETGCDIAIVSFFIEVQEDAQANTPLSEYVICDNLDIVDDGFGQFNLSSTLNGDGYDYPGDLHGEILGTQDPANFTVSFYASFADAEIGLAETQLSLNFNNTVSITQTIYIRVDNDTTPDSICYDITEMTLRVEPLPVFDIDDLYTICVNTNGTEVIDDPIIDTELDIALYSFEWTNEAGDIVGTDSSFAPTLGGNYTVVVTDRNTMCTNSNTTYVQLSSPPIVTAIVSSQAFDSNGTIEASAEGDEAALFEFSIDNGPWVSNDPNTNSYTFLDVSPGEHVIMARDINGCGEASTTVLVMDYPLFFTPNSDGHNDTWQIAGISSQSDAKIYIFDRYGKLLKQLSPTSIGWDGTLNGQPLPSSDYWFTVDYREPSDDAKKQFKAHFTLKR